MSQVEGSLGNASIANPSSTNATHQQQISKKQSNKGVRKSSQNNDGGV
jgi:hypothetical protein